MTTDEGSRLIEQYRAGLDAELSLLRQLADVSHRQQSLSAEGDLPAFNDAADERDRLMQSLVTIEAELRDVRAQLSEHRDAAIRLPGFEQVAALHREATQVINKILSRDKDSLSALADAEVARRSAVAGLELGETTLAAYRRVLAPPPASATLLNRRG